MTLKELLTGIADAIRYAEGSTGLIPAPTYEARIRALKGSGGIVDATLEELEATENGEYIPGDGVDGFSKVVVNVPSEDGAGLYDLLTSLGYTVLFADGELHNQDQIGLQLYGLDVSEYGTLTNTQNVTGAGFYTSGADGKTVSAIVKFNTASGYYSQYGRCTSEGTLPTIITAGTGRISFSEFTGSANLLQVYKISGSDEKFLGFNVKASVDILAVYIFP